jgi:hypothetical protein
MHVMQAAPAAMHSEVLQEALRINQEAEGKLQALQEQAARVKRCAPCLLCTFFS